MIRWTPALLESTYGEIRYGVRFIPYEDGYFNRMSSTHLVDPDILERAHRAARVLEEYQFFVTSFVNPQTGRTVYNLLVGVTENELIEFAITIKDSLDFLAALDLAKVGEGEPIAEVDPCLDFSLKPFPMKFIGNPVQR